MKTLVKNYSFNHSSKVITFSDYAAIRLDGILLISDVTRNTIIYNFSDVLKGGTISGNTLTLTFDTSGGGFADADKLQIFYDDPLYNVTMQNGVTANGNGSILNVIGAATAVLNITSSPSMSGGTIVNFEGSTDDTEWQPIIAHQLGQQGSQVLITSTDGDYRINVAGLKSIRARISGYSVGTITIKGYVSALAGQPSTVGISGSNDTAQTDSTQTTSIGSFIKGLVKIFADVWSSANHLLNVGLASLGAGENLTNNVLEIILKPIVGAAYTPSIDTSFGTSVAHTSKSTPGNILSIRATSINAALRYLQVFNKATTPANSDVPIFSFPLPAGSATVPSEVKVGQEFFGQNGYYLSAGVSWAISTTFATLTTATTTDHSLNETYI